MFLSNEERAESFQYAVISYKHTSEIITVNTGKVTSHFGPKYISFLNIARKKIVFPIFFYRVAQTPTNIFELIHPVVIISAKITNYQNILVLG